MAKKAYAESFREGLERLMHERRREVDEELAKLMQREHSIEKRIISRKTLKGKLLTERGLRGLLSELQGVHIEQTCLMTEGCDIAKQQAVQQHNEWCAALVAAEKGA